MVKNVIEKTPCRRLTKKQLRQLASFTDPGTVLAALAKESWTIEESIQHLVSIAKGKEEGIKTSTQLNAIKYLNQLIIDSMERSGLMVIATKKYVGEDGGEVRFSGQVVSSILRGQKEQTTPAQLSTDIIEKEDKNGESTSKKRKNGKDERSEEGQETAVKEGEGREESSLHTSKLPTGRETESGHFDGISRGDIGEPEEGNSGDFI